MSERPFPPYAYIPGRHPHPVSDPAGHSFGQRGSPVEPLDPNKPQNSAEFQSATALFNAGYYWEAHESWENLWQAAGRSGPTADLLKALIKFAAAGVKAREGNAAGVARHAARAAELLQRVAAVPGDAGPLVHQLGGRDLIAAADQLAQHPITDTTPTQGGRAVLPIRLPP
jgi:hypothetical protein